MKYFPWRYRRTYLERFVDDVAFKMSTRTARLARNGATVERISKRVAPKLAISFEANPDEDGLEVEETESQKFQTLCFSVHPVRYLDPRGHPARLSRVVKG